MRDNGHVRYLAHWNAMLKESAYPLSGIHPKIFMLSKLQKHIAF